MRRTTTQTLFAKNNVARIINTINNWIENKTPSIFPITDPGSISVILNRYKLASALEKIDDDSTDKLIQILELFKHDKICLAASQNGSEKSPLQIAVAKGHIAQFKILIQYGCEERFPGKSECEELLKENKYNYPAQLLLAYFNRPEEYRTCDFDWLSRYKDEKLPEINNPKLTLLKEIFEIFREYDSKCIDNSSTVSLPTIGE